MKNSKFSQIDKFHKTRLGFLIFGIFELALAYAFASLAIDRGNLLWYLLAVIFLTGGVRNFVKFSFSFFRSEQ